MREAALFFNQGCPNRIGYGGLYCQLKAMVLFEPKQLLEIEAPV
jgi:hypothetical protein